MLCLRKPCVRACCFLAATGLFILVVILLPLKLLIFFVCQKSQDLWQQNNNSLCRRDKPGFSQAEAEFLQEQSTMSMEAAEWLAKLKELNYSKISNHTRGDSVDGRRRVRLTVCIISVPRRMPSYAASDIYLVETLYSLKDFVINGTVDNAEVLRLKNSATLSGYSDRDDFFGSDDGIELKIEPVLCLPSGSPQVYSDIIRTLPDPPMKSKLSTNHNQSGAHLYDVASTPANLERERNDYLTCLKSAVATAGGSGNYVLVLEDDSLVSAHFQHHMLSIISQIHSRRKTLGFVKLFHPERLRKANYYPQMIAICVAWICVAYWFAEFVLSKCSGNYLHNPSWFAYWKIFTFSLGGSLAAVMLIQDIGPVLWAKLRYSLTNSVYLTVSESCCTPAVLFPVDSVDVVLKQFERETAFLGHAKDHILDEIPWKNGLNALMTDQNLVYHIGRYSSLHRDPIRADLLN